MAMKYTDQQFGTDLLAQLDRGYDPLRIARWADHLYYTTDCSAAVTDTLIDIFTMQEGEAFHIPEAELRQRAQKLVAS